MLIVVSYDIPNDRRRLRLSKTLEDFGTRVQYSVFECRLELDQLDRLRQRVLKVIEGKEDSVRIYRFCLDCGEKVELHGIGVITEDPDVYIV